jgi:light-regulated signal transduction histidine kinase (bacteriophytochrome)
MVASFVQLLARRYQGKLDADASEFIGFAVDGARRMQDLLSDLLTYSRAGSEKQPIGAASLGACASDAVANLHAAIRECGATVEVTTLPVVSGNPSQLTQVFQNLIGNALKFRSAAPPRVRITAHQQDSEWQVRVADNGIGIDPANTERIFVIFQRLHPRDQYPGTGVGLAICKKTVGRHGGRIWVEPAVGGGSTFVFTLPVVRPTAVLPGEAA